MDDHPLPDMRSRDFSHSYDLSDAVYGSFPSRAPANTPVRRSRASSPAKGALKRKGITDSDTALPLSIKLARSATTLSWLPQTKRTQLQNYQMELHQSTCLNLNLASDDNTDSDLWILPDFDDWEADAESQKQVTTNQGQWAPLLRRAAKSNLERLRARLEGDGWDFVGGKYGEDEKALKEAASQDEESVDEEFDVVVLPVIRASC